MSYIYTNGTEYHFTSPADVDALVSLVQSDIETAEVVARFSPGIWMGQLGEAGLKAYQRVSAAIDFDKLRAMQAARRESMQRDGEKCLPAGRGSVGEDWKDEA